MVIGSLLSWKLSLQAELDFLVGTYLVRDVHRHRLVVLSNQLPTICVPIGRHDNTDHISTKAMPLDMILDFDLSAWS